VSTDPHAGPDLAELLAQVQKQTEEVRRIQRTVEAMEIEGRSRDGEVVVTLCGDGRFTAISIDPESLGRFDAGNLGEVVLEAVNDGLTRLTEASRSRFAPMIEDAGTP
jgi:DNA-binding YbaB/EbfC family protein